MQMYYPQTHVLIYNFKNYDIDCDTASYKELSCVYKLSLLQDFDFHDQFLPVNSAVMIPW